MTDVPWDLRLFARMPLGGPPGTVDDDLGPLPAPLTWTWTYAGPGGFSTLDVTYAARSVRSSILEQRVAVTVYSRAADGSWVEPDNCRLIRISRSTDRLDKLQVVKYRFLGLGFLLTKIKVADPTPTDPADGPVKPTKDYEDPDAGTLMTGSFNAGVNRVIADYFEGNLGNSFDNSTDSNDDPWDLTIPGKVSLPIQESLMGIETRILDAGLAETAWSGRTYEMFNPGSYGSDLSESVVLRDRFGGITSVPEDEDDSDLAARVLVIGDRGQYIWMDNTDDADLGYGAWEEAAAGSGYDDLDGLRAAGDLIVRRGVTTQRQFTREGTGGAKGPKPLRDFNYGDTVGITTADGIIPARCTEISVTWTRRKAIKWHAKFQDRRDDRLARAIREIRRLTSGANQLTGPPDPPGADARIPATPTDVTVTVTNTVSDGNKTRGDVTVGYTIQPWVADENGDPTADPLTLREHNIWRSRAGGQASVAATVGPDVNEYTFKQVEVDQWDIYVSSKSKQGFDSALSDAEPGNVTRDSEPKDGLNKVLDERWANTPIQAARTTQAGLGFAFINTGSRMRAVFTASNPILRTRYGAHNDSGWFPVTPGDKWLVGGTHRKISTPAVSARFGVQWRDAAGAVTDVADVLTVASTTSDVRSVTPAGSEWTVPSGAVEAAWRVTPASFGVGARLEVIDPVFERLTNNERLQQDSVSTDRVQNLAIATAKVADQAATGDKISFASGPDTRHTMTGPLFQTHSGGATGAKMSPSGFFLYASGGLVFEVTATGIYALGEFEAGGIKMYDDIIEFAAGWTISHTAGGIDFDTGIAGIVTFSWAIYVTGPATVNGNLTVNGNSQIGNSTGDAVGFYGSTPVTFTAIDTRALSSAADRDAVINSIRTRLQNLKLG